MVRYPAPVVAGQGRHQTDGERTEHQHADALGKKRSKRTREDESRHRDFENKQEQADDTPAQQRKERL